MMPQILELVLNPKTHLIVEKIPLVVAHFGRGLGQNCDDREEVDGQTEGAADALDEKIAVPIVGHIQWFALIHGSPVTH